MFKIIKKENLNNDVTRITVEAACIAQKAQAGQFIVIIIDEKGERIPLTLADWDKKAGTITLIFQKAGFTTCRLAKLEAGQEIQHILGPLGHPTEAKNLGQVYCVAGGVGVAEIYPVARAFKQAGNRVICIIGSRNKDLLILEDILRGSCDEFFVTTDDGSYGRQGLVTDVLKDLFAVIEKSAHTQYPDLVYCIGPVPMMRAVADLTRDYSVKTIASLNPIMVDATGMCGACRCHVAGKTAFACVDGPDFDAHQVDFGELSQRLKTFKQAEKKISEKNA
ncbi:MAG: sulfide/dihydroorotate dehydrogenase-like FAD/NAD-binding protein [Candidatus Omnitrophica bacterium]|nr:sulfide/dihydroorotate dehydrogenase-like FAD/NAD-binding protein [Candidatus Omnitrophota bacterium]MDD5662347.1 sulfide/dihydroorotate dehydrogenase-like FAD/NAD-binding protein [Candidatus Omnitrophota bacterium]